MTSAHFLADRFDALSKFVRLVWRHYPTVPAGVEEFDSNLVARAAVLGDRAGHRLRLSGEHTVVALAGATGTGKSSLFNALARLEFSPPGHRRPTTAQAHACVWGADSADAVLDWLGVERRFRRESALDGHDEESLHGLVLLDLPDMDSVATEHRVETDRLVAVADLVIWVLDPQKYADEAVHENYLRRMAALHDATVVVFNQTDRLSPADAARCRADLARLVEADGLPGVPVIATSARTGEGLGELRTLLEKAVSGRKAAAARLAGELDEAVADLAPLVRSTGQPMHEPSREAIGELGHSLGAAAGSAVLANGHADTYARGASLPGSPLRARTSRRGPDAGTATPIDPPAVRTALRHFAGQVSGGLPPGWSERVHEVAAGEQDRVIGTLDAAFATAQPRRRRMMGWAVLRLVWWLAIVAAVAGVLWWIWSGLIASGLIASASVAGAQPPRIGDIAVPTALIVAGTVVAILILAIGRPIASVCARRARRAAEHRLDENCLGVARAAAAPVRVVLGDYIEARSAYEIASGGTP